MFRRLAPLPVAALLALGALTGCSDDGGGNEESEDPTRSPTSEVSGSESPEEPYLPVPAGVELTEPGSELGVGETAVIAWQPRQNLVGVLDVDVTRLEQTTFAESFDGWDVRAEQKRKVRPYFVRVTVTNRGETNLSTRLVPLYAVDSTDALIEPTKFTDEFRPCPGGDLPKGFSSGDSAKLCLVYLIAPGERLAGVTFRPTTDFDAITWTGEVQRIEKPKEKRKRNG